MARDLLLEVFCTPTQVEGLSMRQWDVLVAQARRSNLLARLTSVLSEQGMMASVPESPKHHLESAKLMSIQQDRAMRWELDRIRHELRRVPRPIILLKGAAYLAAGLPNAKGRMFGDIDILVPRESLAITEAELRVHGWQDTLTDAYDQRYYRTWMHELPPMRHNVRSTVIDVHHSILPDTARFTVDIGAMISAAQPVGESGLSVLCPVDMVLHSAAHLFTEGEFHNALRDLCDLDSLLRQFSHSEPDFWRCLIDRAAQLGLGRVLYYAMTFTADLLHTPIPRHAVDEVQQFAPGFAGAMKALYGHALRPLESLQNRRVRASRLALYLRAHWLRMPMHLLSYHLLRKSVLRLSDTADH